jgi:putative peptide zinc metalloprotease protein
MDGYVLARRLSAKLGCYIKEGEEILVIGNQHKKELIISVSQDNVESLFGRVGGRVKFRSVGGPRTGTLTRLDPRASTKLPHPALSSTAGGPLAVTPRSDPSDQSSYALVEPRFRGTITLSELDSRELGAGQHGSAMVGLRQAGMGKFLLSRFTRWVESLGAAPNK